MKVSGEASLCLPTPPAEQPFVQDAGEMDECNYGIEAIG